MCDVPMCDALSFFESAAGRVAVALPFSPARIMEDWGALRSNMRRTIPDGFTRDEWAYLMAFLAPDKLQAPFLESFGRPVEPGCARRVLRPRGPVAVWLPNNVSLLGPLTLILLSLTGNRLRLKGGSRSRDLTGAFIDFARAHLRPGPLREHLASRVHLDIFAHGDPRERDMLEQAAVRIVFGADESASAIHSAAPPLRGIGVSFSARRSEAWIEPGADTDDVLANLIRVFAIYGQAGCTSPRRVILLNGTGDQAREFQARMLELWPQTLRALPAPHVASSNTLAQQWAAALGWDAAVTPHRQAVIGIGSLDLEPIDSPLFLPVSWATPEEAALRLPANIQTVGHAFRDPADPRWLRLASTTAIKRLVPIANMHHFGPLWDGNDFWRQCFEQVEVQL